MGTVRGLRYGEGVEANDERSILKAKPNRMPNFDKWLGQAYSRGLIGPSKKRVDSALAFAISEYREWEDNHSAKGLVEAVEEALYDVDQMVDGDGEDIMPSFPARRVEKEFWGWFKAVYPEDSEGFKAATKTGEDLADSDELAKTWFNTEDPEEGVEDSGAGGAAHLFFDNPNKRETREFAESGADSNDPDSSDGSKTPPTPTEIREDEAGGEAFSTLNRLVVETDHPTEDAMPEGHVDVELSLIHI